MVDETTRNSLEKNTILLLIRRVKKIKIHTTHKLSSTIPIQLEQPVKAEHEHKHAYSP